MKINVAITTGYLISGKSVLFFKDLFMVEGLGHIDDAFFPPPSFLLPLSSRSAAYILLLEGDRRQVFCSSSPGSIVCLLLCTGECPIVQ